ncbi:MAG: glycosyltransferase family 4 protein [Desulfomonilaceae bacterium]
MRKILVLTTSYPNNSDDWSGMFIHKLNMALVKIGYDISVLAPSNGEFYGEKNFDNVHVIRFPYFWPRTMEKLCSGAGGIPENIAKGRLAKAQVLTMTMIFLVKAIMCSKDTDIIYANWLGAGLVGALVSRIRRLPLVTSFRGDDGYLARDRLFWRICSKLVISQSSALAPVSKELAEICIGLGAKRENVFTPTFGVDTSLFSPDINRSHGEKRVRIVFVGSLIPKKGLQDLLRALEDENFASVTLDVVGDGYYAEQLKDMAGASRFRDNINWVGLATPGKVAQIMRSSDILCLPSHTEGSPNVVKEAMACGLGVVATRVGGIPDLIQENVTGLLYEPRDINELKEKLLILVNNPDLRKSLGANARERVEQTRMDWSGSAEEFDKIFQRLTK